MSTAIESAIQPLLHSPLLPEIVDTLQARVRQEAARRRRFYEDLRDDQKAEFVDGQVIMHSPARDKHIAVRQNLERLLGTYVGLHEAGKVRTEKCLCVFPRNDYEPDVVFFGPDKAAGLADDTMKFPIPDFVAEVLSESTEDRDRGVKFEDYEAHGVAEYWIIDAEAEVVINGGKSRTAVDILKLANKDGYVTSNHTSTLRALLGGYGTAPTLTHQETSEKLAQFRSAIDFAVSHLSCCRFQGICNASTRAVIARAWYSVDHNELIRFCDILISGIVGHIPAATVLVSLQQFLLTTKDGSAATRRERYGKTERALKAFLNGESISKLVTSNTELFPLPQEARKSA